jgi:HD domain
MTVVAWARELAARHLAESMPRRWSHVQGAAARALEIADVVADERDLLVSAAWLHDLGYAPELVETGFHPLDGARYLRRLGADDRLCGLVAHHSAAVVEADQRGLVDQLNDEFPHVQSPAGDALWYADLTVGPGGESVTVEERLAEIIERYGTGHVVSLSVDRAWPELLAAVSRTERRLSLVR